MPRKKTNIFLEGILWRRRAGGDSQRWDIAVRYLRDEIRGPTFISNFLRNPFARPPIMRMVVNVPIMLRVAEAPLALFEPDLELLRVITIRLVILHTYVDASFN